MTLGKLTVDNSVRYVPITERTKETDKKPKKKNNERLLLIEKHTDTLIEQTKTKPQGTLEFKMKKQMRTFSLSSPINLVEEGKWLLAVSSFECTNSVFNITDENNSFSITIPGHWNSESAEKSIGELNKLLELRSENDIELRVNQTKKKRNQKK